MTVDPIYYTMIYRDVYKENLPKLESSCVGTSMEVQSLQLLSFLYCICHILIVVQDSLGDPNLIRFHYIKFLF
jgi:hypothetical protein